MRDPVDFSALLWDVALQELSLGDSPMQNDILEQLPKSLESIRFLCCSGNPDLEPINRMPNLLVITTVCGKDLRYINSIPDLVSRVFYETRYHSL